MAVDLAIVLVVAVLRSEYCWACRACEVINVILSLQGCDVRTAQSTVALIADQIKTSEVISFTKGILALSILFIDWEEFGSYYLPTVLEVC